MYEQAGTPSNSFKKILGCQRAGPHFRCKWWRSFSHSFFFTGRSKILQTRPHYGLRYLPFSVLASVQEMCARIGMVNKKGITGVVKEHYPKWVLYVLMRAKLPGLPAKYGCWYFSIRETGNLLFPRIPALYCSIAFTLLLLLLMIILSVKGLRVL